MTKIDETLTDVTLSSLTTDSQAEIQNNQTISYRNRRKR